MTDFVENRIYGDKYDIFDRALYGGIGHGIMIIPTHMFKVIWSIIYPPIGHIIDIVEDYVLNEFPYITWDTIYQLLRFDNINKIVYSYVLTSLFYVPGLVYTLANLTIKPTGEKGSVVCDPDTGECIDMNDIAKANP